ncbi:DUF4013 domain-containing protein [Methanobrevibacter woesei]|uniref:DUF4013 domain-containing protein n=1 Tax=Methanobrevibacter woesei TaxID=190976 RepID=UPI002354A99D|nr:DUF4013 domain-containing protein [Methanobrevibacter woesei]
MSISSIFNDALRYPLNNVSKWIILGIIVIIASISYLLVMFGVTDGTIQAVASLINFIVMFIVVGYTLSITRDTIHGYDELPSFDIIKNFIDGIKVAVLSLIYMIIPSIIFFILLFATGAVNACSQAVEVSMAGGALSSDLAFNLIGSIGLTFIISLIIYIIFMLFATIAYCRLADTGSFSQGFSFSGIIDDIRRIGVGSYIVWWIVLVILIVIILLIAMFVAIIPYIGYLICLLFIASFVYIFIARATGLIYSNN